ncbi:hypothetical protein FQN49_007872, partial [Arthroderma sp. PD_2]
MTQEVERTPGPSQNRTVRVSFESTADPQASNPVIQPTTTSGGGGHHRSATSSGVQLQNGTKTTDDARDDSHSSTNESRPASRSRPKVNGRRKPALIRAKSEHWHDLGSDSRALGGEEEDFQL